MTNAPALLPTPTQVTWGSGGFLLPDPLPIRSDAITSAGAALLGERLSIAAGIGITPGAAGPGVAFASDASLAAEEYRLEVDANGVRITAADSAAAVWATQTLLQTLPVAVYGPGPMEPASLKVPQVVIQDHPRFGWRGSHLDVARHFMPIEGLFAHLEVMAMHKLNRLHLHLTDDQGWRLPVAKYPLLTEVAAWRPGTIRGHHPWEPDPVHGFDVFEHDGRPHGGFYTVEQLTELQRRAQGLGITVIPEIDMPGHMEAAIAAYPWLGACDHVRHPCTSFSISEHVLRLNEATIEFCTDVLDAVMEIFPEAPIHIGGDECSGKEWLADPESSQTMADHGLTTTSEAQAWFLSRMFPHLQAAGRRVVAWDEVLEGEVPEGTIVMVWRSTEAIIAAAQAGLDVVAAPEAYTYLDHPQHSGSDHPLAIGNGMIPLSQVSKFHTVLNQIPQELSAHLLGGQFQLWTEYIRTLTVAQYFLWPRGSAIAEQLWTASPVDPVALAEHTARLTAAGVNWCREQE